MKVYISGAITGIKLYREIFNATEEILKDKGYDVINPCELNHNHDLSYEAYMKEDLKALLDCDSIYMIPGWEKSQGANFELQVAVISGIKRLEIPLN